MSYTLNSIVAFDYEHPISISNKNIIPILQNAGVVIPPMFLALEDEDNCDDEERDNFFYDVFTDEFGPAAAVSLALILAEANLEFPTHGALIFDAGLSVIEMWERLDGCSLPNYYSFQFDNRVGPDLFAVEDALAAYASRHQNVILGALPPR